MPLNRNEKKRPRRTSGLYEVRIADPKEEFRIKDTRRGIPCRIDRHPDDLCEFYDQNNTRWCLFGFTGKQFTNDKMVGTILRKKIKDTQLLAMIVNRFGGDSGLRGLDSEDKRRSISRAVLDGKIDPVKLAKILKYTPVRENEILSSGGKIAVLVKESSGSAELIVTGEILEVSKLQ
jgi:hypothetical protein